jgi:2-(3-amino-3-carboxypropyl)histidine synthase
MRLAELLKARIERDGMSSAILVANTFDFESLSNMREFDAFVNTACPRIAIDDCDRLPKPLLSANELMSLLSMKTELEALERARSQAAKQ